MITQDAEGSLRISIYDVYS